MTTCAGAPAASIAADTTAREIASLWAEAADRRRRLPQQVVDALSQAGFMRHFVPARHGGAAGGFTELLHAVASMGEVAPSAAWCAALYAAHGRLAAYLPDAAQDEIWGQSPDTPIAAAVAPPRITATPAAGGWLLTGAWSPASGVDHAAWILLSALAPAAPEPLSLLLAVPAADCVVQDTWHSPGMRGTGSNTVVLDRVFVPAHRTVQRARLLCAEVLPGVARCHSVPYPMVAAMIFAAPVLGAARGALATWQALAAGRLRADLDPLAQDNGSVDVLATASGELHAAALLLESAARRCDAAEATALAVAENMRDCCLAGRLCVTATDRLAAGTGEEPAAPGRLLGNRRDVLAAADHAMLRFAPAAAGYARACLGAD
jgi:alkylation response protein AidB-like acyl-CoA dehydrogenase